MRLIIQESYSQLSQWAAAYIVKRIKEFGPSEDRPFVLGLPTGSTPLGTYRELIKLYNEKKISFANVVTLNISVCRWIIPKVTIHSCGIIFSST